MKPETLIIGVGNRMRRDDGVGLVLAEQLAQISRVEVSVAYVERECYSLLELWSGVQNAYLVDALHGPPPGTLVRIDAISEVAPTGLVGASSHGFGVAHAIELARAMGKLPKRLVIYAVAGEEFSEGEGLSPVVERAAKEVVVRLGREIADAAC